MRRSTRLAGKATKTVVDDGEDDEVVEKKKRTKSKVVEDEESFGKDAHDDEEEEEADVVVSEFSDEPKSKKGKKKQGKKKKKKKAEHEEEDDGAEEKPKKSLDSFPSNKFISKEQYREIDENKEKFAKYTIDGMTRTRVVFGFLFFSPLICGRAQGHPAQERAETQRNETGTRRSGGRELRARIDPTLSKLRWWKARFRSWLSELLLQGVCFQTALRKTSAQIFKKKRYFDDTDYQRCNKRFNFSQIHRLPLNESFFLLH
jgi:hypothetical protein